MLNKAIMENFISLPFLLKIQKFENDRKKIISKTKAEEKKLQKKVILNYIG